jgi:hypothetical protein
MRIKILTVFLILFFAAIAHAATLKVSWDYPADGAQPNWFNVYHQVYYANGNVSPYEWVTNGNQTAADRSATYAIDTAGIEKICVKVRAYRSPEDMGPWSDQACIPFGVSEQPEENLLPLSKCTNIKIVIGE